MSTVWRGLDTTLGREVAVKVLHPHLAEETEARQRFQREAHAVAKLHHPNILQIFDYSGVDSPSSYIVTEFIRGRTLKQFLAEHRIVLPEIAAAIVAEVGRALAHAHSLAVIHRDLKPENVMIREDGVLKLMDFGIAQILDIQRMTLTGELIGSPAYMAPEQVDGKPLDFRTDVFSLGTLLYQLSTGDLPFRGRNPHEVLKRISDCQYVEPTVANPCIDDSLTAIIKRALSRNPDDRFPNVGATVAALEAYLEPAGLGDGRERLTIYFANPEACDAETRPRIVDALVVQVRAALGRGETALGFLLINRALCRDPKNTDVQALLDRLSQRRRLFRTLGALGVLGLLVIVGLVASRYIPTALSPTPEAVSAAPTQPRSPPPIAAPQLPPPLPAPAPHPPAPLPETPSPAATPAVMREIAIVPWPRAVRMTLDDRDLGWYGPDNAKLRVTPGAHRLVLENPLCEQTTITIGAEDRRREIRPRLVWKPARITVNTAAPNAEIVIAGRVGRPGAVLEVPLPNGPAPEAQVPLIVRAPGFELHTSTVRLRAGEIMPDIAVNLRAKTP